MDIDDLIQDLRKQIEDLETEGKSTIETIGLRRYLDLIESEKSVSQEQCKIDHANFLAEYAADTQWGTELFKAVLESGKSALHAILIINGGAVIALMGVMSSLIGNTGGKILASNLALPLLYFGIGVFSGGVGFAFRYLSQACYTEDFKTNDTKKYELGGDMFRWLAVLAALSGFTLFLVGIVNSYSAFDSAFKP